MIPGGTSSGSGRPAAGSDLPLEDPLPDLSGAGSGGGEAALWRGIGTCVRGAHHVRTGQPCQDALGWSPSVARGSMLVMAVADGHGNAVHARSETGARLAVAVSTRLLAHFLKEQVGETDADRLKENAAFLPAELERAWKAAVDQHLSGDESDDAGLDWTFDDAAPPPDTSDAERYLAYGTTLILAGATPHCLLTLQIGDGDLLVMDAAGKVWRPLPVDKLLTGSRTTSLCLPDAASFARMACLAEPPTLVVATSDGYANSFRDDEGFLQVVMDYRAMVDADGPDWVASQLGTWLEETSASGSGDDITIGIMIKRTPDT